MQAQTALAQVNWNLEEAVQLYLASQEEANAHSDPDANYDDGYDTEASVARSAQPAQASSSTNPNPARQRRGQMTIDDLKKITSEMEGEGDDDKPQDMFAGGEKSGLAVQNPDQAGSSSTDHFKNIMRQAQQNRERPEASQPESEPPQRSNFRGPAQTLGGEGEESRRIEDPLARMRERQNQQRERVSRVMHLWADGVSIDDGPLFRFDDPANQGMMEEINRGRAPLGLLDVAPDQEVDLNLEPHKDENYVQPKKKYKPFGGSGQRLGSPTPGTEASSSAAPAAARPAASTSTSAPTNTDAAKPNVDESAPTLQLQIRLGDGSRLQSRFNTTHTIGDVYDFVNRASVESTQRSYALMTTFPSKELSDKSVVLGDMSDFKRGGVVVQKWT